MKEDGRIFLLITVFITISTLAVVVGLTISDLAKEETKRMAIKAGIHPADLEKKP